MWMNSVMDTSARGAATDAVEDRHQLGHGRHLHEAGRRHRDDRANEHGEQDQPHVVQRVAVNVR
jgi:hypothetical protein